MKSISPIHRQTHYLEDEISELAMDSMQHQSKNRKKQWGSSPNYAKYKVS